MPGVGTQDREGTGVHVWTHSSRGIIGKGMAAGGDTGAETGRETDGETDRETGSREP